MGAKVSDDEYDLIEAIEAGMSVDLLSKLANYAEKRLSRVGWFTTAKLETHKMSPKELVDLAIQQCVEGERHRRKDSKYTSLETSFSRKSARRSWSRWSAARMTTPIYLISTWAVIDGHTKREDIAAALGWEVGRVTAARVKLQGGTVMSDKNKLELEPLLVVLEPAVEHLDLLGIELVL